VQHDDDDDDDDGPVSRKNHTMPYDSIPQLTVQ
jgi:hypothetical protein